VQETQALPAEKQIEAVAKKLQELNPRFTGKVTDSNGQGLPTIENGAVTKFSFINDYVTDISPVRAFAGLKLLRCSGSSQGKGNLTDLSPLRGMALTKLFCTGTKITDLSPLKELPLKELEYDFVAEGD